MLATDLNYQLSEHFRLSEATRSQIATRNGINNRPPIEFLPKLSRVAETILEPARAAFGKPITPSSWYRSQGLERALKGEPPSWISESQHAEGEAVDFEVAGVANHALARYIAMSLEFDQLILEYWDPEDPTEGWVHASYATATLNRREVKRFDGQRFHPGLPA